MLCLLLHHLFLFGQNYLKYLFLRRFFFSLHVVSPPSQVAFPAKITGYLTISKKNIEA